jgi:hypothetical protein
MPPHTQNQVLRRHREIDGVPEEVFARLLKTCRSKAELQRAYVAAFARARALLGPYRWIDKTPQNIYGGALILGSFPAARLLHIVRNPLNVVASMLLGRQVAVPDLHGAINYWCEAVQIAATLRKAAPDRIMDLRYEDLVADVPGDHGRACPAVRRPSRAPRSLFAGPMPIPNATSGATRSNLRRDRDRSGTMRRFGPDLSATTWRPASHCRPLDLPVTGRIRFRSDRQGHDPCPILQIETLRYDVANLNCGGCAARAEPRSRPTRAWRRRSELRHAPRRRRDRPWFRHECHRSGHGGGRLPGDGASVHGRLRLDVEACIAGPAWRGPRRRCWRCPA